MKDNEPLLSASGTVSVQIENMATRRNLRLVSFYLPSLVECMLLRSNPHRCIDPLPPDAILVGSRLDTAEQRLILCFLHHSFSPVPEGQMIPEIRPSFQIFSLDKEPK